MQRTRGEQATGPITFTTTGRQRPHPDRAAGSAINVGTFGAGTATVTGTVNANGEAATYHFDYGMSTNYTSQTISEPISSTTAELVDAGLTGLSPNTVYHYRIEATDAWGTSYGADQPSRTPELVRHRALLSPAARQPT